MTLASNPAFEPLPVRGMENTGRERAFQALLACAFLKQQMDLRLATQQLSRQDRRLRSLADTQNEIRGREMDGVLTLLVERTLSITGANGAAIALAEQRGVVCRASSGNAPPIGSLIDPESGFSGLAILSGEILRCDDSQSDERVDAQSCAELHIRSLAAVPLLRRKNNVVGLLEVFSDKPDGFGDREINVLRLVAGFILEAVQAAAPSYPAPSELSRTVATQVIPLPEHAAKSLTPSTIPAESGTRATLKTRVPEKAGGASEWGSVEPNILAAPDEEEETEQRDRFLPFAIAILFVAALVAGAFAWKYFAAKKNSPLPNSVPEQKINQFAAPAPELQRASTPTAVEISQQVNIEVTASQKMAGGGLPKVTDIRHWSTPESSTVVVELERILPFLSHRLHAPERIYLDLQGSQLAPELKGKAFEIGDGIVDKIRIASPQPGVSRVVLDTQGEHEFTTSVSSQPARLMIEVRK